MHEEKRRLIRISLEETITCPADGHRFPLREGLQEQTIRELVERNQEAEAEIRRGLEAEVQAEVERKQAARHREELEKVKGQQKIREEQVKAEAKAEAERWQAEVAKARRLAEEATHSLKAAREAAKAEAQAAAAQRERELTEEKAAVEKALVEQRQSLQEKRLAEIALRTQLQDLEARQAVAVAEAVAHQREQDRASLAAQAREAARVELEQEKQKLALKQAELEKQRDEALKSAEDLKRKMEQRSMQTQGEVLELSLQNGLAARFPHDQILEVKKGIHGADLIQKVVTPDGRACGSITWETKNAQNWSEKWIDKLKEDQLEAKSECAVLVTAALPETVTHFGQVDGVWVCSLSAWPGVATALRQQLIQLAYARAAGEGRDAKMELLFKYLSGPEFRGRVEVIVRTFMAMQEQLEKEKRALKKHWSLREKQVEGMLDNVTGMYGDLQGIIGTTSLPEIPSMALETEGEDEAEG